MLKCLYNNIRKMKHTLEKKIAKCCVNVLGGLYLKAEKYIGENPERVLGVKLDQDLRNYERKELCNQFDKFLKRTDGEFYSLSSTTKIRLGVQVLRNLYQVPQQKSLNGKPYEKIEKLKVDYL